jgi:hypothetical protein
MTLRDGPIVTDRNLVPWWDHRIRRPLRRKMRYILIMAIANGDQKILHVYTYIYTSWSYRSSIGKIKKERNIKGRGVLTITTWV